MTFSCRESPCKALAGSAEQIPFKGDGKGLCGAAAARSGVRGKAEAPGVPALQAGRAPAGCSAGKRSVVPSAQPGCSELGESPVPHLCPGACGGRGVTYGLGSE